MKPIAEPIAAERYYYIKWRSHCFRLLLALAFLSNGIIWAVVAGFYSFPVAAIWFCIAAVFALFVAVVEYRACDLYHTRYLRALCDGSLINPNPTE